MEGREAKPMSDYTPEDERESFNVRSASPEEIEAYIGNLQVEIERLRALLNEIVTIINNA
jgi:uncharacterized small protein (DUF1192 family)